ncbi:DUF4191 domain-containing protein [Actinospica durhamensis]|uniref:DUF4191 domain-containing protein n=1 Tax=Actinospica durhamensis TaxID=1508375 RepID=A0A941EU82_9ACTN|nr:DUF4191 family protein [Actinospica durhamensis]MBR7838202.1 DUF4191 domain-containing protein [Actinospica durhamensis]
MANPSPEDLTPPPSGWLAQLRYAYTLTKKLDSKLTVALLGWGLGVGVVVFLLLFLLLFGGSIAGLVFGIVFGIIGALLAATMTLNRRVQRAQYKQIDGQPGAAYSVIESDRRIKKNWALTPVVQVNRQQDAVHRLIGRGGIVLIAEGDPARTKQLVSAERKAVARYLGPDVKVDEIVVGPDEEAGQVPLNKLVQLLAKRAYRKQQLTSTQAMEYSRRLEAIASKTGPMANMPKGPLPKGARMQRGGQR